MDAVFQRCIVPECAATAGVEETHFVCPRCGGLLDVAYDWNRLQPPHALGDFEAKWSDRANPLNFSGVWRFRELIPFVEPETRIISLSEGSTPLVGTRRAGWWAGPVHLTIKHQGNNPTGSFKDLGMTACITRAVSKGVRMVACASTGNTSSSMAAYAARAGMKALIFVPYRQISAAKLAQALDFGALVVEVGDTFDEAFKLLREIAPELGLYLVNSVNPFRIEGQKTIVAEMMEQRAWRPPDYIVVPGGNLGNASAIGKGLRELKDMGFIEKVPRVVVIQAAGANPFYRTLASGSPDLVPVADPRTEATAIRIGNPASWKKALRVIRETEGTVEQVSEVEIAMAKAEIGAEGIGCEPASAVTLAGLKKLVKQGFVRAGEMVVLVLTGHALKDADFTLKFHRGDLFAGSPHEAESAVVKPLQRSPLVLEPSADAVVELLRSAED